MAADPQTLRVLIVDDNPEDRFLYRRLLAKESAGNRRFEVGEVDRGAAAVAALEAEDWDCVLLDYGLPDRSGIDILDDVVGDGATPSLAFVMLTGQGNEQIAVEAMKRGVQDYLLKGTITQESLVVAILRAVEKVALRRELDRHRADLVRSNRELSRFASVVAHDLQNPLATLQNLLRAIDADSLPVEPAKQELLRAALVIAERMQSLVVAVLDYARPGGDARDPEEVSTAAVFDEVVDNLSTLIHDSAARVTRGELPPVRGHRDQLRQVFQNLIANGLKYHGGTPPEVHVSCEESADRFRFLVADRGAGIDPARQEEAFAAFSRLSGDEIPGHGLGLSICKKLVEQHGGQIGIESAPGAGTTVWFTIPRAAGP